MKTDLKEKLAIQIATFGGIGFLPKAPGTWGSLGGAAIGYILLTLDDPLYLRAAIFASILLGVWAANIYQHISGGHDRAEVVIDEVAGMLIVCLPLHFISLGYGMALDLALAFILFRFFDIMKPPPIGWLDKNVSGGLGVMLDDIAAGAAAAAVFMLIYKVIMG